MKIAVLIITYNRCDKLKKCFQKLNQQIEKPDEIIVVNNNSTDSTLEFLRTIKLPIHLINNKENIGGAGAYHLGFEYACKLKADYIICVEDDILLCRTFIKNFKKKKFNKNEVGFIFPKFSSIFEPKKEDVKLFLSYQKYQNEFEIIEKTIFASLIVSVEAIKKVGLPIQEFFIYFDDWEFTQRIRKSGMFGIYYPEIIAWHNDLPRPKGLNYINIPAIHFWKSLYGIRNELTYYRKNHSILYLKLLLKHLIIVPLKILFKRKEKPLNTAIQWFYWSLKSVWFNYKIKKI